MSTDTDLDQVPEGWRAVERALLRLPLGPSPTAHLMTVHRRRRARRRTLTVLSTSVAVAALCLAGVVSRDRPRVQPGPAETLVLRTAIVAQRDIHFSGRETASWDADRQVLVYVSGPEWDGCGATASATVGPDRPIGSRGAVMADTIGEPRDD